MKSRLHLHTALDGQTIVGSTDGASVAINGSPDVGGRLLCLAAAGCYANTLFAETVRRGITVQSIDVDAELEWIEHPVRAQNVTLSVRVEADADELTLMELVERADRASEVANALRLGVAVCVAHAVCMARHLDRTRHD
jgi:organic hydroperoxide reductase OsmC/OhrA